MLESLGLQVFGLDPVSLSFICIIHHAAILYYSLHLYSVSRYTLMYIPFSLSNRNDELGLLHSAKSLPVDISPEF